MSKAMAALSISSIRPTLHVPANFDNTERRKFTSLGYKPRHTSSFSLVERRHRPSFKTCTNISSSVNTTETANNPVAPQVDETQTQLDGKFDWYAHWYPLMPVCDLDKRVPHAKKVLGIDVVIWWDRNQSAWKVFDDACPHRLAPLSEGRIDQWGRLQCVYGWCFNGSGDCKLIPQAPTDAPPVHTSKKACVGAYPSTVQNGIVWFWPSSDPQYRDILSQKKPPFIPEMDDSAYSCLMGNRDLGYEDVSPGNSRLITTTLIHHGVSVKILPRWIQHIGFNKLLDSDVNLLHLEERRIRNSGIARWEKACFVPTKSDAAVIGFRKWIYRYAGGQVDWRGKFSGDLPPSPPKEQLMDRYRSHVVNCSDCNAAHNNMSQLRVVLQVVSFSLLVIVAASKQGALSSLVARSALLATALLCFACSTWLAHFMYKIFHFHDYNHALL